GIVFGFAGAAAVVAASVLLAASPLGTPLRRCGARSIVIYLAFFLFMAGSRTVLMKLGVIGDPGLLSLAVTAAGVVGPLVLFALVRRGPLAFLFHRPASFRLTARREPDLAAA
ncbi:MAG TPA: acyltransferase, partial [Aestuariivirgaceae bacterium]|nr:acyltransferase [Aestuariivirgaceae bacterium]